MSKAHNERAVIGAFLLALIATLWHFGQFVANGIAAVRFPKGLDSGYGEGIVWEQIRLMLEGRAYGSIDGFPAIVFHYPPVYHMLTALASAVTGIEVLAAGRTISLGSTVLVGLLAGVIATRVVRTDAPRFTALICGLVATLCTFCFGPLTFWAPLMRVDMLAIALSFSGLLAAMASLRKPGYIFVSALLFVIAVFTKQTSVAAPTAVFLSFLLFRPRLAVILAVSCILLGLVVLTAMQIYTDGGFFRHIFLYNVNRIDPWRLFAIPAAIFTHILFAIAVIFGVGARFRESLPHYRELTTLGAFRSRLISRPGDSYFLIIILYGALAALMSLSIAKSGSGPNYLIEPMAVAGIILGIVARNATSVMFGEAIGNHRHVFAYAAFFPLLIALQAFMATPPANRLERSSARADELELLENVVRAAKKPIISDEMVVLVQSGVPVYWEPAIFAELAKTGVWNEKPLAERIKSGFFALFITAGVRGNPLFDSRYNPAIADAIDVAYPVKRKIAGYTVHLPDDVSARNRLSGKQLGDMGPN